MPMNFSDSLNKNANEIEKPPLQPAGHYRWVVEKQPVITESGDKKWDFLDFQIRCLGPHTDSNGDSDVDADELQEFVSKAGEVTKVRQRHRFMFDKEDEGAFNKTLYNVKRFLVEHLGVEEGQIKQMLAAAVNRQFVADIVWRPDKNDSETFFANIGRTAPVE